MLNIAQIGVGYWGPNLLRNLVASKRCVVKTVVDLSPERREFVKGLYPAVATTSEVRCALTDRQIDGVVIATPVATHFDLTMKALDAGKHVLVEKPMARSVAEVERIAAAAKKAQRVAMVGHTFVFNSAVRHLKRLIDSGEIGHVRYIYSQRLNLGRIRSDVDALWNFAPHDISIVQYLLDNTAPLSIVRQGMDYVQKGIEDVVFLHLVYPSKVMVHIHVSWLDPHKVRRMTVVGTKKMVVYDDVADEKITIYDKGIEPKAVLGQRMDYDRPTFAGFDHRSGDILVPKIDWVEPLRVEIDHFLDCIEHGTPCLTGTDHAREVVRILSCQREGT
ncbi:MAG: Gfo/Idh/MocA family oxidoreductase [Phycisphaerae bacterium]|nr:Gfo/Idh/MocA family oxidoreductase [Phycisphaerae bacterium]